MTNFEAAKNLANRFQLQTQITSGIFRVRWPGLTDNYLVCSVKIKGYYIVYNLTNAILVGLQPYTKQELSDRVTYVQPKIKYCTIDRFIGAILKPREVEELLKEMSL